MNTHLLRPLRGVVQASARTLSSTAPVQFDEEASRLYNIIAKQHLHPNGPWNRMVSTAVQEGLMSETEGDDYKVIDLATGPGEPANLLAQAMPLASITATDISEDMMTQAKAHCASTKNVDYALVDMQDMSQFDD